MLRDGGGGVVDVDVDGGGGVVVGGGAWMVWVID